MSKRTRVLRGLAVVAAFSLVPVGGIAHAADTTAPPPISELQVFTHVGSATLTWIPPVDPDFQSCADHCGDTIVQMKIGTSPPANITDGVLVNGSGPNLVVPVPGNVTWVDGLDPGTDFTFGIFARDDAGNISSVTSKTMLGTDLSLSVSHSTVTYGGASTFTATLRRSSGSGSAVAGVPVDFYVRQHGTKAWFFWQERHTNGAGVVRSSFNPGLNIDVQAYFYGSTSYLGTATSGPRVDVAQKVAASANHHTRKKGKKVKIRGTVTSKAPGTSVDIQRYRKGAWHKVKTVRLTHLHTSKSTTTGSFTYSVKHRKKGKYTYRAATRATSKYVASYSGKVRFRVR